MTREEKNIFQDSGKKCRKLLLASIGLVIALSITKMVVSNRASSWGETVVALKQETESVRLENQRLQTLIAENTGGLHQLESTVAELGFTDEVNFRFFPVSTVAQTRP